MTELMTKPRVAQVVLLKVEAMFKANIMKSGLYNWHRALDGEFIFYKDVKGRLSEYDILLVIADQSTLSHAQISRMREELGDSSDTIIVASMDYAAEMWQESAPQIGLMQHELSKADFVFASEQCNQEYLSALLGRDVPVLPHPADVANIKKFRKAHYDRERSIFSVMHKWETNWLASYMAGRDHEGTLHKAVFMFKPQRADMVSFFDEILPPHPADKFPEWCDWMSKQWIYLDPYNMIHTFGRTPVECAALGLCCVGSEVVHSIRTLYPELVTPAGHVNKQRQLIKQLLNDNDFYSHCSEQAITRVEDYSYANRRREFMEMIGYADPISKDRRHEELSRSAS